jgi:hypothetical protein
MGLLDFIFAPFQQAGQQTAQNVTGQVSSSPAPAPVQASQPASQQQVPQSPFTNPVGWLGGAVNYVGSGVTNISSGIQTFIQPVAQPITQAIVSIPAFISAPVTAPVIIGSAFIGGVQSFLNPPVQQQITSPIFSSGVAYTPVTINPVTNTPQGMTIFTAYGNQAQVEVKNINAILYGPTGGSFEATQVPYGHSISNIVASGGTGSLQSGMFTLNPATPVVYTQESAGTVYSAAAVPAAAALVLASPQSYSRLGAEAYGGYVMPLDNRTIQSTGAQLSTYSNPGNLANLVNPYGVNQLKQNWEILPWNVPVQSTPSIIAMDTTGRMTTMYSMGGVTGIPTSDINRSQLPVQKEMSFLDQLNYDIGGFLGIRASGLEQTSGGLPAPFRSTYGGETTIVPPTGNIFGYNLPVVSPILAFFEPGKQVTTQLSTSALPEVTTLKGTTTENIPGGTLTTQFFETAGGKKTTTTTTETPTKSGFDLFEQSIRNMIPSPEVGEQAVRYASLANPFTAPTVVASLFTEKFNPEQASNARAIESLAGLRGQYTQFYEHPAMVATSYAIGAVFGTATKGIQGAYEISRASAAEQIISRGQTYRAAEMYSGFVMENAPKVLGALYVGSIAQRSTEGFTNFAPENVATKSKGLVMQEAVPMGAGFMLPGQVVTAAKVSDIGYKAAIQEGITTGRLDYYVKQPVTRPYEMAKIDYAAYQQETPGTGITDYAAAKASNAYRTGIEIPIKTFIQEAPGKVASVPSAILEPLVRARVEGQPAIEAALGKASIELARYRYGETPSITERAYSTYFNMKLNAPLAAEGALVSSESALWAAGQYARAPGTNLKAAWQEWRTPERLLYLNSYGGYNFISQGLPPQGWAGIDTIGTRGIPTGGLGGTGGRTETKIVGGKQVTGLSREPSLKSQGIIETSGRMGEQTPSDFASKRSVDYRGSQSQTMKPMKPESYGYRETKQATGQMQIFSEQLPMVEGMTEGKVSRQQIMVTSPFTVPAVAGLITVTQPDLTFSQASEIRQQQVQQQEPVLGKINFAVQVPSSRTGALTEVSQASREEQIYAQFNVIAQRSASQTQQAVRGTVRERDILYGLDTARITDIVPASRQRNEQVITPYSDIRLATDITPRTSQIVTPQQMTTILPRPWQFINPTVTPFLTMFPNIPGSGGLGGGRKRRGAFVEIFNMGLDYSLKRPSKRQGKSWTQPKKVQIARAASKKGGKKK